MSTSVSPELNRHIKIDQALPQSSILLMGYAVEMYLKSALARLLAGCSENLFSHLCRREFSHDYLSIANFLQFPIDEQSSKDLELLHKAVLHDARYPLRIEIGETYIEKTQERRQRVLDRVAYRRYSELANKISSFSKNLTGSVADPLFTDSRRIDVDGYISCRSGGGSPPLIIYRISTLLSAQENHLSLLRDAVASEMHFTDIVWPQARIYEETGQGNKLKLTLIQ